MLHILPSLAAAVLCIAGNVCSSTAEASVDEFSSPWGWRCETQGRNAVDPGYCRRMDATVVEGLVTLNRCKLTCGAAGVLWPLPTSVTIEDQVSLFLTKNVIFEANCLNEVCNLLDEAFEIFKDDIQRYHPDYANGNAPWTGPWDEATETHMLYLDLTVSGTDSSLTLDTDESYELSVTTLNDVTTATIIAPTYFGARHAMETLTQLIEYHETADSLMVVTTAEVKDSPVFPYRGLLLDTSRNFVSVATLKRTLDAMAASKLNTLHWHITDSHSFPLFLRSIPEMANYGAYSERQVYTAAQVADLVQYARVRGVRLLPELDAPAHVGNGWQWGEKVELGQLAVCVNQEPWYEYCVEPPCGQLNLANENMYIVLDMIYHELVMLFLHLDMFHFGGDEVNLNCWNSTEEIFNWMVSNNFGVDADAYYDQWAVFQERARHLLLQQAERDDILGILWTSHLTQPGRLESFLDPSQYIIQLWSTKDDKIIGDILSRGYRVIFSNHDAWYLDCGVGGWVTAGNNWCSPYKAWQAVYDNSPYDIANSQTGSPQVDLIMGGEAALWTEQADDATIDSKLWPRGAALAERLWSNPSSGWSDAEIRFIHHRQRQVQRGVQAERIQPQWCHQFEGLCRL